MAYTPTAAPNVGVIKDAARDDRLRTSKSIEERIGKEWRAMAMAACDMPTKAYWLCRQEAGLAVVWQCRQQSDDMKLCVTKHSANQEAYEAYRKKRVDDIAPELLRQRELFLQGKLEALFEKQRLESEAALAQAK